MPSRIRSSTPNVSGGGGGPGVGGTVAWGPSYGQHAGDDSTTHDVQAALDLAALAIQGNFNVRAQLRMPALALTSTKLAARANLGGTALGAPFWQSEAHTVRAAAVGTGTFGDITIAKPSGTVAGDLLLAFIVGSDSLSEPVFTTPSGWTLVASITSGSSTTQNMSGYVYWRIADGTEGASFTWTATGVATDTMAGEIHRINGTHATTPVNAFASGEVVVSDLVTDPVIPAVTTTVVNCLVFCFLGHGHGALSASHTSPANHIERTDYEASATGAIVGMTTSHRVFAAAASTGTATVNCTETVGTDAVYFRVAIAPGTLILDP